MGAGGSYDAEQVRKSIEGQLGYALYDCVWSRAVRDYGVEPGRLDELKEAAEDLQRFANEVEREAESVQASKHGWSASRGRIFDESEPNINSLLLAETFRIDNTSRAALRAISKYATLKADENPEVTSFRSRVLGTDLLSMGQARDLLYSHAARFLTWKQLWDFDVPLLGHKAFLLEPYRETSGKEGFDHMTALRIEPPDISLFLRYTNLDRDSVNEGELVRCEVENGQAKEPYKVLFPPEEVPGTELEATEVVPESGARIGPIQISGFDTALRPANVWPGSLVDEVYRLAQELSETFMWPSRSTRGLLGNWWDRDAAALFVLTGVAPLVHPLKVWQVLADRGAGVPSRVRLEIMPWLTLESLLEFYRGVRNKLGVNLRNQGDRKFDVFTFVLMRTKSYDPDDLNFTQLRKDWNKEFPERKFRDTNSFSTNYKRGLEAVEERYYL